MSKRPTILVFNKFYVPGFRAGGPIQTLSNMVERLGGEFDFRIITQDRDSGDRVPYDSVNLAEWNTVGRAAVRYLSPKQISLSLLAKLIVDVSPNAIYLNSFFDPIFTQRVLALRKLNLIPRLPCALAPRGEFSGAALGLKGHRKAAFLLFAEACGWYGGLVWQASSEHEKNDIVRSFGCVTSDTITVAMNLAPASSSTAQAESMRQRDMPLKVCFLSRISPMKNLDFALSCFREVKSKVTFTVYGPRESPEYWRECEAMIGSLPDNVSVVYSGVVEHSQVRNALREHDLFFLPTRGENYGHAIFESLSSGLPVLISDRTPWTDVDTVGVGWALPLDGPKQFAAQIDRVAQLSAEDLTAMRERAVDYASRKADDQNTLQRNREFLSSLLGRPTGSRFDEV